MKLSLKTTSFVVACIIGIALVLIHVPEVGERQEDHALNSGELTGTNAIGQTIVAQKNNLSGIGVIIATYSGRDNTHPVTLHLRNSVSAGNDIRTVSASPTKFGDNQFYNFLFPAIADSKGKTYFFLVDSPESVKGNAIAIDLNNKDTYLHGTGYVIHTANNAPATDNIIQRSGKQTIDVAFQTLYSVPAGTFIYHSITNAIQVFINTWNDNRHEYALWTGAFVPSVIVLALCFVLFRFKKMPKTWMVLLGLAIIGAVIRIFYALELPFTDDEGNYLYDAWSILHGHFAGGDGYVKAPLVIAWVAVWEAILGHTAFAGRLSSIIAGSALVYPVFLLVRSIWTTRAALVSAALWACMGTAVVSTIYVHTQSVAIFFGMSGIALLAYALKEKMASPKWLIIAGAVIGLAVASRKSMLALGLTVILLLVTLSKNWNARLRNTLYVGIGFIGVLALFMLYAYTVYGGVGITEALGINSAEDGISSIDPDQIEQIREYDLKGMTPFFRESLPIILLSMLGVGFYLQDAFASLFKKTKALLLSRIAWVIPLGIFWWAWDFFSQYEGAKFMKYGVPTLWWLFGITLIGALFLPSITAQESKSERRNVAWLRGLIGLIWVGSMMFFYAKWIKFHANYISEFIPPLTLIAGVGLEAFIARSLQVKIRLLKYATLTAFAIIFAWSATVSSYITYSFEHTGTFDQKAAYEAAAWIKQNVPKGEPIFTGASLIPYLAGYQTVLNISHPRWYAYEFTRTNPERIQTFLPRATDMVASFATAKYFLLDNQTQFSYLNEYDPITNDLKANWKSVKGISNGSNTLVFSQRIKPAK
ncbi:MAG: glycosyltransferase family 39 protein [Candidatus Andersenbacteria bacterium]|nr:glycosyltransferase family 39 protein [Candidatus Andersenbacteria bacterium]